MGASRFKIARLLLAESVLLGLCGSLLGLLLAVAGVHLAVTVGPYLPGIEEVRVDFRIFLFAMSLGVLTGLVFGLTPALRSSRLSASLSARGRAHQLGRHLQQRAIALVFALTTVLLVAGGLLTRSFWNLIQLDVGFEVANIATVRLPVLPERYEELDPRNAFFDRDLTP